MHPALHVSLGGLVASLTGLTLLFGGYLNAGTTILFFAGCWGSSEYGWSDTILSRLEGANQDRVCSTWNMG